MDSSFWLNTISLERYIVHKEESHVVIFLIFLSLNIVFVLAKSVESDEIRIVGYFI